MSRDVPVLAPRLNERAKHRLRLAAALLRAQRHTFDVPRDQFYPAIQAVLAGLPAEQHARLKSCVDWVEEYERAEAGAAPATDARREPSHRKVPARRGMGRGG